MSRAREGAFVAACLLVGVAAGLVWRLTTPLVGYTVTEDGRAVISENDMVDLFTADARFSALGAIAGLVLGLLALWWLRRRGAGLVAWAVGGPVLAGLACWLVGVLGGTPMAERVGQAAVGDVVPVDLALSSPVALAVWPFVALLPVLVWTSFAADPDGKRHRRHLGAPSRSD